MLLIPDNFAVTRSADKVTVVDENLDQITEELMLAAQEWTNDAEIQFEHLISFDNEKNSITYTVSPWDTLSGIAKLFGTTSQAIKNVNALWTDILRVWQKLIIGYEKSIIYQVKETQTVQEFADRYDISMEDLLTLNYFEDEMYMLNEWQEIFLPLNKIEAERKGLLPRKKFVMLDLKEDDGPDSLDLLAQVKPSWSGEQIIISPEQTAQHLEQLEQAKKEAELARKKAEELAKQAQEAAAEAKRQAEEAQKQEEDRKAEEARRAQEEAERKAEEARKAQEEAERKAAILRKAEEEDRQRREQEKLQQQKDLAASCAAQDKCYHDMKCWTKPAHAVCSPEDPDNAWLCEEWYIDTWRSCITKNDHNKRTATATAPKKSSWALKQRYFNPYDYGYSNGRWWGHCTHYAWYIWWSKLGISTNWRWNAKHWYNNASAAWWQVGQTPEVNSIVVMKYGSQWWNGYGHVWIVIDIDRGSRQVLIEDMNYVGRYIVSQHWIDMDSTVNPIIWYVYPRKK